MITTLDWDSKFFLQKIGKVQVNKFDKHQLSEIQKEKRLKGFDLIYLFIDEIEPEEIQNVEAVGARLVDQKVTYYKQLSTPAENRLRFETFEGKITPELLELALASGHKSRFFKDPRTKPFFKMLYTRWLENSVNKEVADEVLVCRHDGVINSFVTLKKNDHTGSIGLIAVDKNFRGMGIGKELLIAADNWYTSKDCLDASVVTQLENTEACGLYEKAGYNILNSQYIFHY